MSGPNKFIILAIIGVIKVFGLARDWSLLIQPIRRLNIPGARDGNPYPPIFVRWRTTTPSFLPGTGIKRKRRRYD